MDGRATAEVAWVSEYIGAERVFRVTADRLEDHPAVMNLLWERNHHPERFASVAKVLTIDGVINHKLTGRATAHYSAAPFFGVDDILDQRFDTELLEEMGLDPALMPELCRLRGRHRRDHAGRGRRLRPCSEPGDIQVARHVRHGAHHHDRRADAALPARPVQRATEGDVAVDETTFVARLRRLQDALHG